jgi:ABC-type branched-subunit amino acid transport system substrate-binding protein
VCCLRHIAVCIGLVLLVNATPVQACVKAEIIETATDEQRPELAALATACHEGLRLLRVGDAAKALPLLQHAAKQAQLLSRSLALPLAEAMYGAGLPVEQVLKAWEGLSKPVTLVEARRRELVDRLLSGRAAVLLKANSKRPATRLLRIRAKRDRTTVTAQSPSEGVEAAGRLGVLLPLSGPLGAMGQRILRGIRVGLDDKTTVLIRDTTRTKVAMADLVRELVQEGVTAIIGPLSRKRSREAAVAAETEGVPLLRLSVADVDESPRQWVFRVSANRRVQCQQLVNLARRDGSSRFAIAHVESLYGNALAAAFKNAVEAAGAKLVNAVGYSPQARSLTKVARNLRRKPFDALFVADVPGRAGHVLRFLAREDIWTRGNKPIVRTGKVRYVQVMGPSEWHGTDMLKISRRYSLGARVAVEWPGAKHKAVQSLKDALHKDFGQSVGAWEAVGYDVIRLAQAARSNNRAGFVNGLRRKSGFRGVLGHLKFDASGEPVRTIRVYRVGAKGFESVRTRP